MINAARRLGTKARLRWRGRVYSIDNDDVYVDTNERVTAAGPHAGTTYEDVYGRNYDWWRLSALDRDVVESGLDQFALTAPDYVATHGSTSFDFSQSHTYSDLDTSRLEGEAHAKYKLNDRFWVGVHYRLIDFTDDAPYLYDTSGTVKLVTAAMGWVF